jgi:hypothetical protein
MHCYSLLPGRSDIAFAIIVQNIPHVSALRPDSRLLNDLAEEIFSVNLEQGRSLPTFFKSCSAAAADRSNEQKD